MNIMKELILSREFAYSMCIVAFESLCTLLLAGIFFKVRAGWKKWHRTGLLLCMIIGSTVIARLFPSAGILKGIMIVLYNTLLLTAYYSVYVVQAFFVYLVSYGINLSTDLLAVFMIKHFWPEKYLILNSEALPALFITLLCKIFLFLIIVIFKFFWRQEENLKTLDRSQYDRREWLLFFYFPVFTFISCWIFERHNEIIKNYFPEFYFITFGLILVNILVLYLMKYIVKKEKNIRQIELMNQRNKSQLISYYNLNKEYDKQRKYLHDYKNQLNCIQGMLHKGEVEQAVSYIASLTGSMIENIPMIHTGNPVVDAVINQKYNRARSKNISVTFSINSLSSLSMREEDIVSLLANLFDNAIEACEKLPDNRRIFCKLIMEEKQFIISIQNPLKKKPVTKNGHITTDKKDKELHGIGLISIESIISQYDGRFSISAENQLFSFSAVIPLGGK